MDKLKVIKFAVSILFGFFLTLQEAEAQVTIGTDVPPISGALLDLKQDNQSGVNSKKGVGMPRVNLTNSDMLYPMFKGNNAYEQNQSNTKDEQDALHTGLIVYNTNECLSPIGSSRGLFVWTGSQWQRLGKGKPAVISSEIRTHQDQDGNTFISRIFGGGAGEWMLQNLQVRTFDDGTGNSLSNSPNTSAAGMIWKHPVNSDSYPEIGYLYNGSAVMNNLLPGTGEESQSDGSGGVTSSLPEGYQGICPSGWHIPSDMEWVKLEKELYLNASKYSSQSDLSGWGWDATTENLSVPGLGEILTEPCLLVGSNESISGKGKGKSFHNTQGGFSAKMAEGAGATNEYVVRYWTSSGSQGGNLWTRYTMTKYDADGTENQHLSSLNRVGTGTFSQFGYVRCKRSETFRCGDSVTDREGNTYHTASFGNKCWFTDNMKATVYPNGTAIAASGYTALGDASQLGYLYSWNVATQNTPNDFVALGEAGAYTSDVQGICPDGWFVPSDNGWNELEKYIDANHASHITPQGAPLATWDDSYASAIGLRPAASVQSWAIYLKSVALNGWSKTPNNKGFSLQGSGSTLDDNTPLPNWADYSQVWTSSATYTPVAGDDVAIYRGVYKNDNQTYRGTASRTAKLAVRCVQPIQ